MNAESNWIVENTKWLYQTLWTNSLFYIDYWSIVHLLSGGLLFVLICSFNIKRCWLILISTLIGYEVLEILIKYFAFNIFLPETFTDQITDLFIGTIGAVTQFSILKYVFKYSNKKNIISVLSLTSSFTISVCISFLYAGYNSSYSDFDNRLIYNFVLFFLATFILISTALLYNMLFKKKHFNFVYIVLIVIISSSLLFLLSNHTSIGLISFNLLLNYSVESQKGTLILQSILSAIVLPVIAIALSKKLDLHFNKAVKNIFSKNTPDEISL